MESRHRIALEERMRCYRERVERALERWLPGENIQPRRLHQAMRYSTLNGGKRVRATLVYATGEACGADSSRLDGPACAVEFIHAYSLVHDDLPAMDNDDLRRGKPSCHRAFGEATAILAGDALQTLAFYVLARDGVERLPLPQSLESLETLALASGSRGMAGGQAIDLAAVGKTLDLTELENMHVHKTGALIRSAVKLGALSTPDLDRSVLEKLDRYAKCVGLAFQIQDDILDVEGNTEQLGKQQGADIAREKPTYPALIGLERAKRMAHELHDDALDSLADLDLRADPLRWLADYIVNRVH